VPTLPSASGIYAIIHVASGRRYVGSAVNIKRRIAKHLALLRAAKHWNRHLQASWAKHGATAFRFDAIELCDASVLLNREQRYIDAECYFNICKVAGNTLGVKPTQAMLLNRRRRTYSAEDRAKISVATKIGMASPEVRQKIRAALLGVPLSADRRAKIAAGNRGKTISAEQREKIRASRLVSEKAATACAARIGTPLSAAHRANISASRSGIPLSDSHRASLSLSHKGKPWSEARRAAFEISRK
jgi:group I intron endonuclease